MELLFFICIILVSSLFVWKGGALLETSSEALSVHYKLPPVVRGSIIMAVGSSFPELSTTVISTLIHGKFDLGVSAIIGSAIFNILVIPALSVIVAGKLDSNKILIYRDAQFYVISVIVLLFSFSLAAIYYPVAGEDIKGTITRPVALIPVLFYLFYFFFQMQETHDFKKGKTNNNKNGKIWKEWLKLIISLILIIASVEGLVRSAIFLGDYFNTPDFLWGIIVIATATSVPDAYVSIRVAVHKKGVVSLSNVLGSNIFDLLIAVPAGILIAGSSVVNFSIALPIMIFLIFVTLLLIVLLRWRLGLLSFEGWILLAFYLIFIIWMVLESFEILSLVI